MQTIESFKKWQYPSTGKMRVDFHGAREPRRLAAQLQIATRKALAVAGHVSVRADETKRLSAFRRPSSDFGLQALPQQLPGPAQPAWPGDDPQQAVSPGPGMALEAVPDREE